MQYLLQQPPTKNARTRRVTKSASTKSQTKTIASILLAVIILIQQAVFCQGHYGGKNRATVEHSVPKYMLNLFAKLKKENMGDLNDGGAYRSVFPSEGKAFLWYGRFFITKYVNISLCLCITLS